MQRNIPGLLDRRIGPKDMFIVLLYMYVCILLKSLTIVVLFIKFNLCCVVRLRCMHELLMPLSTPYRVYWLHFRGVGS